MSQRRKVARRVRDGVPIDRKALRDLRVRLNVSQNDLMMRADKEGDDIIGEGYISTLEREGGKRDRKKVEAIEKALQKLCDETGVTYRTIRLAGSGAGTLGVPMQATVGTSAAVPLPSNAGLSPA
jgi:transcriptional regulator with XRE-family HTH domain